MGASYTCVQCHGTYQREDDWTDEDAEAEARANGFDVDNDEMVVICDDCYRGMGLLQAMLPPGSIQ